MTKKKQLFLKQRINLTKYINNKFNVLLKKSLQTNFEINNLIRIQFFIHNRDNSSWNSHKTLICPYTFSCRVPNKSLGFSRFYYVKYTTFLSNSNLRQL